MWIVIRLVFLVVGFYVRYLNLFRKRFSFTERSSSQAQYGVIRSTHKGNLIAFYLGVPLESNVIFRISQEKDSNKILKRWGLAAEIQTGDVPFDDQYYIGSDHVHFNQSLRNDPAIRTLIHNIISTHSSIEAIYCDGLSLYLHSKLIAIPADGVVESLHKLADKIRPIASQSKLLDYKDPFFFKLLIFESICFALLFYAFESFIEHIMINLYSIVSPFEIFLPGVLVGLGIGTALVLVFFKLFRESSRGQYVLLGNLVLLFCSSPFWGTKSFIDLNQYLDKSPVMVEKVIINSKRIKEHRHKGRTNYSYHWYYRTVGAPEGAPVKDIALPLTIFNSANENDVVEVQTRKGAFDYPYRLSINNFEL